MALILRMATEKLSWGCKRICGELKKLGISVGLITIRDILKRSDCPQPPEKTKSRPSVPWSEFVSAHMESLVACDFFTKPVYTLRGKFDFCKSFIGTCKHQCLNHFVCFGLGQLAHINRVWLDYYHTQRPHQGTGNNVISANFRRTFTGPVKREERLDGIVAWYEREAA